AGAFPEPAGGSMAQAPTIAGTVRHSAKPFLISALVKPFMVVSCAFIKNRNVPRDEWCGVHRNGTDCSPSPHRDPCMLVDRSAIDRSIRRGSHHCPVIPCSGTHQ